MAKRKSVNILSAISASYDLSYFTDEGNIPNQDLVKETIAYFETGPGSRVFKPLEFLNLLENQYQFVVNNWKVKDTVISGLKSLPLNDLEKHVLFGLLLKWFGGYPIIEKHEGDHRVAITKKAIEQEFLKYKEDTPEKIFCMANSERRNELMKYSITGTTALRTGVSWQALLEAIDGPAKKITYKEFDDLFEAALVNKAIGPYENELSKLTNRSKYNFNFNVWLQKEKGWEYGDENGYQQYLTKEIFIEFLKYEAIKEQDARLASDLEAKSWKIEKSQQPNIDSNTEKNVSKKGERSKLTWLLHDYYLNECKPLTRTKVIALASRENLNERQLIKRWNQLEENNTGSFSTHYKPTDNHISVKSFAKAYNDLMRAFQNSNKKAFKLVETDYKTLKRNYPTYLE